jgi:alpha-tubulin suppressor-like RCC1 family protein
VTQIAAGRNTSYAITNDGLYAWGSSWTGQLGNGSFGKLPDGSNERGQTLPVKVLFNNKVTAVTDVEAGEYYALAITDDGVYAWGMNVSGCLGTGSGTTALPMKVRFPKAVKTVTKIAASTNHTLAITNDGLYAWGNNSAGQLGINKYNVLTPVKVAGEDNAVDVGTAEYSTIAIH